MIKVTIQTELNYYVTHVIVRISSFHNLASTCFPTRRISNYILASVEAQSTLIKSVINMQ